MQSDDATSLTSLSKTPRTGVREGGSATKEAAHPVGLYIAVIPPSQAYIPPAHATIGMRPPGVVPRPSDDAKTPEFQRALMSEGLKRYASMGNSADNILSPRYYLYSLDAAALEGLSPVREPISTINFGLDGHNLLPPTSTGQEQLAAMQKVAAIQESKTEVVLSSGGLVNTP